ncbi:HIT domain-containing protein [Pseudomethylobacillus aquaticus]|uniref:HIT domain-containing protein n=1 Tax=Pseudomethylobacillus aquaticus TaxID=2676064 RepID=A0A3N0V2S2_9PROT|nr:HIT domain-containing protein [Pseudomethylobacillus aquaticus]ROH87106.1 HIT domain-containing protein [Pseudomethylobacillus aquaticus]
MSADCIFCKIIRGEIPSTMVHQDDQVVVFKDIHPIAPVHLLIVPRLHVASLAECAETERDLLGHLLLLAPKLAAAQGLKGFRTMINTGREGGQEVFHLHVHVFGGGDTLPRT